VPESFRRRGRPRLDDENDQPAFAKRNRYRRALPAADAYDAVDGLPDGDRWSTWDRSTAATAGRSRTPRGWSPTWARPTPS
jgi:hypothetical protein